MATAASVFEHNAKANSDLSSKQFYLAKFTAADTVDIVSAVTDLCCGVINNAPKANQAASLQVLGIAKVVSDGSGTSIAVGDRLAADTSGRVVKTTTVDRPVIGIALDASTAAGSVIRVLLLLGTQYRTPL